jgi:hypothetical protein
MDLFPMSFTEGLDARMTGPGKFRFILQPVMSIGLGIRDGIADAKQGNPPYFIRILFKGGDKVAALKSGLKKAAFPLGLGVVLDLVFQWLIFHFLYVIPALLAGTLLVAFPYSVARGVSNRVARRWYDRSAEHQAAGRTAA